jgi:hypothetical protein
MRKANGPGDISVQRKETRDRGRPTQSVLGPDLANLAISSPFGFTDTFTQIDIVQTHRVIQSYLVHTRTLQLIFSDDTPITRHVYYLPQNAEGSYNLHVPKHQFANM